MDGSGSVVQGAAWHAVGYQPQQGGLCVSFAGVRLATAGRSTCRCFPAAAAGAAFLLVAAKSVAPTLSRGLPSLTLICSSSSPAAIAPPAADFGFDPLGLCDPEGAGGFITPEWLSYSEVRTFCVFDCCARPFCGFDLLCTAA